MEYFVVEIWKPEIKYLNISIINLFLKITF